MHSIWSLKDLFQPDSSGLSVCSSNDDREDDGSQEYNGLRFGATPEVQVCSRDGSVTFSTRGAMLEMPASPGVIWEADKKDSVLRVCSEAIHPHRRIANEA